MTLGLGNDQMPDQGTGYLNNVPVHPYKVLGGSPELKLIS